MAPHPIRAVQDAFDERQRTFKAQQALSKSKGDTKVQAASAERLRSTNGAGVVGGSSHSNPAGFNPDWKHRNGGSRDSSATALLKATPAGLDPKAMSLNNFQLRASAEVREVLSTQAKQAAAPLSGQALTDTAQTKQQKEDSDPGELISNGWWEKEAPDSDNEEDNPEPVESTFAEMLAKMAGRSNPADQAAYDRQGCSQAAQQRQRASQKAQGKLPQGDAKVTRAAGGGNLLPGIFERIGRDATGKLLKAPPTLASIAEIDEQEVSPLINRFIDASERGDQETALKMLHKAEVSNFSEQVVGLALRYAARNGCTELAKEILGKFPKKLAGDKEAALLLSYKEGHQDIALDILKAYPYRSDADLICACQATHSFGHKDFTLAILKTRYHVSDEAAKSIRQTKARESIVGQIYRMLKLTEAPGRRPLADVERKVQTENTSGEELKSGVENSAVPNHIDSKDDCVLFDLRGNQPKPQDPCTKTGGPIHNKTSNDAVSAKKWVCDEIGKAVDKMMLKDPQKLDEYFKGLEQDLSGKEKIEQLWSLIVICERDWFMPSSSEAYRKLCNSYQQIIDSISHSSMEMGVKWDKTIQYSYRWMKSLIKEWIADKSTGNNSPGQTQMAAITPPLIYALRKLVEATLMKREKFPLITLQDHPNFNGQATCIFNNGITYQGEFENGEMHGQGMLIYVNGNIYKGEFRNAGLDGQGIFINSNDHQIYEGGWENSQRDGYGKFIHSDGEVYEGGWKDNKKHGQARLLVVPSGDEVVVRYEEDKMVQLLSRKWTYEAIKQTVEKLDYVQLKEMIKDPKNLDTFFEHVKGNDNAIIYLTTILSQYTASLSSSQKGLRELGKITKKYSEAPTESIFKTGMRRQIAKIMKKNTESIFSHLKDVIKLFVEITESDSEHKNLSK